MKLTKRSTLELQQLVGKREDLARQNSTLPPEDLMEQASDFLIEPFSRVFFMTIAGSTRLLQVLAEEPLHADHPIFQSALGFFEKRFSEQAKHLDITPLIRKIAIFSLFKPNLNVTLKRLTHVLSHPECVILADGFLVILHENDRLQPEKWTVVESVLEKLLLSPIAAREVIERFKEKHQAQSILAQ